jgi:outer membrane protein assembly factor BamB
MLLAIGLAGWTFAQPQPGGGDWPQFRGPGGAGVSSERGLCIEWSSTRNLLWKVALPGAGASSPVVVRNRIFVTRYSGYGVPGQRGGEISDLMRHLLCLELADGTIVWQKEIPAGQPESPRVTEHGYASSTPVSDGERLYVCLRI